MEAPKFLFSSESVSEGHPDKVCDQISDAILDAALAQDKDAHVACETFATTEFILIGGELSYKGPRLPYEQIARDVLRKIGYTSKEIGIGADTCEIMVKVQDQSADIAMGVNRGDILQMGAGDQGIMFGYATTESEGYMPLPITIAHKLVRVATSLRKNGELKGSRPDMKSQVTIEYLPEGPRIDTVLMSVQHDPDIVFEDFKKEIVNKVMIPVAESFGLNTDFRILINPTGRFVIGGPRGDTGLTGRKLIVDTYGGSSRHGGGAFSGKDPSKVDRSASYYARYIAKNLVAAGAAERLEVQLSYAIGVAEPLSFSLSTFGTKHYEDSDILMAIEKFFDARPGAIISAFGLNTPTWKYADICNYGVYGRPDIDLPWERLDKVEDIKAFFKDKKRVD